MSDSSRPYSLVVDNATLPVVIVHGGAGSYVSTTTPEQRAARGARLADAARAGFEALADGGARAAVLAAVQLMERDQRFNAGRGSRLQRDGKARLSAALMDGRGLRSSAVYNVQGCLLPSGLADALQGRGDRNLDGEGARALMAELGLPVEDVRTPQNIARWEALRDGADHVDRDAAIGDAGEQSVHAAREAGVEVPDDLLPPEDRRHGTVGAVAVDLSGELWACTSTGGRGHESVGRVSDTPTPAGNYACAAVGISATGFGEQILDLNVTGRIATRILDGATLRDALTRTFDEVVVHRGLLGVIALCPDGAVGYAHSTEACGVAWLDGRQVLHVDRHGRA